MDKAHNQIDKNIASFARITKKDYQKLYDELKQKFLDDMAVFKRDIKGLQGQELTDFLTKHVISQQKAEARLKSLSRIINSYNSKTIRKMNEMVNASYVLGFNAINPELEKLGVSFSALNDEMLNILLDNQPDLLPKTKLNKNKDMLYNYRKMQDEFMKGIVNGEDIDTLAERLQAVVDLNYNQAVRNARTINTRAENQGRNDRFNQDKETLAQYGYEVRKVWIATDDERTRPHHKELDGTIAGKDGYFKYGLRYPADPKADPSEVWNCRCSLGEKLVKIK